MEDDGIIGPKTFMVVMVPMEFSSLWLQYHLFAFAHVMQF